jgi:hypothetical protein
MPKPIGDAERAELAEVAVIEDQNEMAWLGAQAFNGMGVPARKVPDVARGKVVGFRHAGRIDERGATSPFQHERPFGCGCMPVEFSGHSGFQTH